MTVHWETSTLNFDKLTGHIKTKSQRWKKEHLPKEHSLGAVLLTFSSAIKTEVQVKPTNCEKCGYVFSLNKQEIKDTCGKVSQCLLKYVKQVTLSSAYSAGCYDSQPSSEFTSLCRFVVVASFTEDVGMPFLFLVASVVSQYRQPDEQDGQIIMHQQMWMVMFLISISFRLSAYVVVVHKWTLPQSDIFPIIYWYHFLQLCRVLALFAWVQTFAKNHLSGSEKWSNAFRKKRRECWN